MRLIIESSTRWTGTSGWSAQASSVRGNPARLEKTAFEREMPASKASHQHGSVASRHLTDACRAMSLAGYVRFWRQDTFRWSAFGQKQRKTATEQPKFR